MYLIILPGNSQQHKVWSPVVKEALKDLFSEIYIIDYTHWQTGEPVLNVSLEQDKLVKLVDEKMGGINKDLKSYAIFAKSAGVLLAVKSIFDAKISPNLCIFLGTPLNWASEYDFDYSLWLKNFSIKTLFIQQRDDPYCKFADLKTKLEELNVKNYTLKEIPGDNHHYDDTPELTRLIKEFIV